MDFLCALHGSRELLFIHNHVALANEMVMWAIASHGGNRARGEKEKE